MTIIQSIILGIVEGVTEFLPISSTAHMEFAAWLLRAQQTDFLKSFEIIIQFGAILAVVLVYATLIWKYRMHWKKFAAAFIPTAVVGFLLYKVIKNLFLGNLFLAAAVLAIGGVAMIIFERKLKGRLIEGSSIAKISYKQAVLVGLAQSLAVVPGVSRSAATIYGGMFAGLSRETIVDFSFILAIPTMAAAAGYDLLKNAPSLGSGGFHLIAIGFIAAFVSAFFSIRFFLSYVKRNDFTSFGIYRIIAGIAFFALAFIR